MSQVTPAGGKRGAARRWPPLGPPIMAVLVVVVLLYVSVIALGFPVARARIHPVVFGATTLFAAVLSLTDLLRRFMRARSLIASGADPDEAVEEAGIEGGYLKRGEVEGLLWFAGLIAAFVLFGFIIGMTAFMVVFLRLHGRESWWMTLGLTAGTMAVLYFLFIDFLGVRVYPGLFTVSVPFLG